MTWRRMAPWVIGVITVVALFISIPRSIAPWLPSGALGAEFRTVLGLDLQGGLRVTLLAESSGTEPITDDQMETARTIIESRVAGIGVSEPQVRTETAGDGSRRIVVEVPGVSDQDQVRSLVGSTGQLQFINPQGQQLTDGANITEVNGHETGGDEEVIESVGGADAMEPYLGLDPLVERSGEQLGLFGA